jgi:hypothetical protein
VTPPDWRAGGPDASARAGASWADVAAPVLLMVGVLIGVAIAAVVGP